MKIKSWLLILISLALSSLAWAEDQGADPKCLAIVNKDMEGLNLGTYNKPTKGYARFTLPLSAEPGEIATIPTKTLQVLRDRTFLQWETYATTPLLSEAHQKLRDELKSKLDIYDTALRARVYRENLQQDVRYDSSISGTIVFGYDERQNLEVTGNFKHYRVVYHHELGKVPYVSPIVITYDLENCELQEVRLSIPTKIGSAEHVSERTIDRNFCLRQGWNRLSSSAVAQVAADICTIHRDDFFPPQPAPAAPALAPVAPEANASGSQG